jgi:hypothetical protein
MRAPARAAPSLQMQEINRTGVAERRENPGFNPRLSGDSRRPAE